jgi:hypothetical protein
LKQCSVELFVTCTAAVLLDVVLQSFSREMASFKPGTKAYQGSSARKPFYRAQEQKRLNTHFLLIPKKTEVIMNGKGKQAGMAFVDNRDHRRD